MKTFSRLSLFTLVCFGFALMLLGNIADAVSHLGVGEDGLTVSTGKKNYEIGEKAVVTFFVAPAPVVALKITATGVDIKAITGAKAPFDLTKPFNTVKGSLTVEALILTTGATIKADWPGGGNKGLSATAYLTGDPPKPYVPIICVDPPKQCFVHDTHDSIAIDPKKALKVGDLFAQDIRIKNVTDLSAWQMNVVFNPHILEVVSVEEGEFLAKGDPNDDADDVDALFLASNGAGWIPVKDQAVGDYALRGHSFSTQVAEGKVAAMQARIDRGNENARGEAVGSGLAGVSGSGILMTICFRVLEYAEEPLGIHNVQLSNSKNDRIDYSIIVPDVVVVTDMFPDEDVNRDGSVDILDLVLVASNIGLVPGNLNNPRADANGDGMYSGGMYSEWATATGDFPGGPAVGDSHSRVDVNNDGIVNVLDVVMVARSSDWGGDATITHEREANNANENVAALAAAPSANVEVLTPAAIQAWIDLAQIEDDGSAIFDVGIANLESLLVSRIPSKTKLLLNYPNPFNPETWIPYQLAKATDVTVMIHAMNGSLIRTIELGHQAAGTYQSKSQAAYWDGRNEFGEQVASGLYFYTLTAGDFSATGRMLVRK